MRPDWQYYEPNSWDGIIRESDASLLQSQRIPETEAAERAEAAFLGSACGCILGKPLEINPTLHELKTAFEAIGEWPLNDYVSEKVKPHLREFHEHWPETTRENIQYVAPDDDINYTILGMLTLEKYGPDFTHAELADLWREHVPINWTWGPERIMLARSAVAGLRYKESTDAGEWASWLNPGDGMCGAMIRGDAFGYACMGDPVCAARLAWKDASFTHRRTGVYGSMFVAAAIAAAPVVKRPLDIFHVALCMVPRRSRFYAIVNDSLDVVRHAKNWMDGYERIHEKYGEYGHCQIFQETATLINTLRFAESVGHGICLQVMQGNDTDSYGATAGSILGAYFGPGHLEARWLEPFNDDLRTRLAGFYDRSLSSVAKRMGRLPALLRG